MSRLSNTQVRFILIVLVLATASLFGSALLVGAWAKRAASIPTDQNYAVQRDGEYYYYKPTGPFDVRTRITQLQYDTYQRIYSISRWLGVTAILLWFAVVIIGLKHNWQSDRLVTRE